MRRMGEYKPIKKSGFSASLLVALVFLGILALGLVRSEALERAALGKSKKTVRTATQPSQLDRNFLDFVIKEAIGEDK